MKLVFSLFLTFFSTVLLTAQEIYTEPDFPTFQDSIVVYFDATQATGRGAVLNNYTGDLYAHTGVKTPDGDWQFVIESWGNNSTQPKLVHLGNGLYKLEIGNPYAFYNIEDETIVILQLNFVFRTPSGSQQTEDLFVRLYEPGIKLRIEKPTLFKVYPEVYESVDFKIITSNADQVNIYLDDEIYLNSSDATIDFQIQSDVPGRHTVKIVAESNMFEPVSDSVDIYFRNQIQVAELPSNVQTGINYIDDVTVTLALYAPNKDFVYLAGDFNNYEFDPEDNSDWEFDSRYYMNITPDSSIYWKTLSGLTPTQEYRFVYLVDGHLYIADPYADKILEPDDQYISDDVYPNLMPYPSDLTNFPVSVFQTAEQPYQWEVTDFERPAKDNLIVYEMLVRDFVSTHSYQTIIDTLDYLSKLGINALELMPVLEFEFNNSWGYNTSFYFAPDKYYGTKNDLKKLVDECHKRGIAVILDIVLNHMYGRSSFVRLYSNGDYGPPSVENPWFNVTSPNPVFSFGYDLNHESEQTKELVDRVNKYWLEEYNVDGYRFDFTKGFTNTPGDGGSYDAARIEILKRMANKIWEYDPDAYVILEHFAPDSEERVLTNEGMLVWGNMNYNYNEATMGYIEGSDFSRISWRNRAGFTLPHLIGYMESHDEERLMYKNLQFGNTSGFYSVNHFPTATQRIKLAATFFIPIPGPKMIWQFGELGYNYSIDYNGRVGEKPIRWDYNNDGLRKNIYHVFSELNNLKRNYEVFRTTDFLISADGAVKRIKLSHYSMNVVIIGNFDVYPGSISPDFHTTGTWYDFFNADSIEVTNVSSEIELQPGEFRLFTSKKVPFPDPIIITDVLQSTTPVVDQFMLMQNYPNPFNPSTTITYQIAKASQVNISVFNVLGEKIKTVVNVHQNAGLYSVNWDGSNYSDHQVPSGVYIYKLTTGNFTETMKMILLR